VRRQLAVVVIVAALGGTLAACGGGSSHAAGGTAADAPAHAVVKTAKVGTVGTVLVNSKGRTLYVFAPDAKRGVTCSGACAGTWPPVFTGKSPTAGAGVQASLLGTDPDPAGGSVVTYAGWPLYTYVADISPGIATGQALDLNGGYWYVMAADGTPVVPAGSPPLPGS
jgi:predicted lipoprotein with Yx(FWY)xxD motif